MMNKYTSLIQKYLKILIFTTLILSLFVGFGMLFRTSKTIETHASRDPAVYKSAFFQAMHEQDLSKGRIAYTQLKKILSPEDTFLTEIAPAYMADLYVRYAKVLSYDKKASEMMLTQARQFMPEHPEVLAMLASNESTQPPVADEQLPQTLVEVTFPELVPAIPTASEATEILAQNALALLGEIKQEIQDGPPRIPYIDPPPLIGFSPEPEYELVDEPVAVSEEAPVVEVPKSAREALSALAASSDPCSLAYLTRSHALTPCIDPVTDNRFGPALFVVGKSDQQAKLAFTQHPITQQEYDIFCDATGQCYEEVEDKPSLIDLSDVQETVHDYNAYCQMSGTCEKIVPKSQKPQKPLTRGQAQRYALWLSKTTGYKYRHATPDDQQMIQQYFKRCVNANSCSPGILESVATLMEHPDTVLVREVE